MGTQGFCVLFSESPLLTEDVLEEGTNGFREWKKGNWYCVHLTITSENSMRMERPCHLRANKSKWRQWWIILGSSFIVLQRAYRPRAAAGNGLNRNIVHFPRQLCSFPFLHIGLILFWSNLWVQKVDGCPIDWLCRKGYSKCRDRWHVHSLVGDGVQWFEK